MAADCMTRVWALAIATAACVGLPGALVYALVRTAAARRLGATVALSVFLVVWVTASAAYYPRVCADIVRPWSALVRRLRARDRHHHGGMTTAVRRELPNARGRGGARVVADDALVVSLFVARTRQEEDRGGMGALRREPPALASPHERQRDGKPSSKRCVVCLCDVEEVETATWLPACLHMFHRNCIHQWLHVHGHSTCPICRRDAFVCAAPSPPEQAV